MSSRGHVPIRRCLGCGGRDRQAQMLRVVRDAAGQLKIDSSRCAGGRGGYLHPRAECWERFARRKGAVQSLRAVVDRRGRAALLAQLQAGVDR